MPAVGEMRVYNGSGWVKLTTLGSTPPDFETYGMPKPMKWEPADHGGGEPEDDPVLSELCEVLLCPNCDMELSATACTPQHAYLADNPAEHRLLQPLLEPYLKQMRFDTGQLCHTCSTATGHDVVIATGDCNHLDVRGDQVLMSKLQWDALVEEVVGDGGARAGLEDRLRDSEEDVGNLLTWHYYHRSDAPHLSMSKYWRGVAAAVIKRLIDGVEETT